ncbi:MAG: transcription-repair coupling factor, partial [Porcincola intestinalis]|nr:transcription-repair coupling factor [Porcincola intestinalis]
MMKALYAPMLELEQFRRLRDDLKKTAGMHLVSGCIDSQKTHLIACLSQDYPVSMIIASNDLRAREIYENYQLFSSRVLLYPARDVLFFQADVQSMQLTTERVRVMKALASSSSEDSGENGLTVIVTLPVLMSHCMPAERWVDAIRSFSEGDEISLTEEQQELSRIGYEKCEEVQQPGQYAVRGGILDIYPLTEENPVRIELWGDEIDSIRSFDAQSQRTIDNIASV